MPWQQLHFFAAASYLLGKLTCQTGISKGNHSLFPKLTHFKQHYFVPDPWTCIVDGRNCWTCVPHFICLHAKKKNEKKKWTQLVSKCCLPCSLHEKVFRHHANYRKTFRTFWRHVGSAKHVQCSYKSLSPWKMQSHREVQNVLPSCASTHTQFFKMTYGQGMVIRTSSSCMSVCSSSYSMLTSQPLLLSDGQQLTVKHTYNDISAPPVCLSFLMPLPPPSLFKLFSTFWPPPHTPTQ